MSYYDIEYYVPNLSTVSDQVINGYHSTLDCDLALFRRLGLKTFRGLPQSQDLYLGTVWYLTMRQEVQVVSVGGLFYKITIIGERILKGRKYEMRALLLTGSGSLHQFWDKVNEVVVNRCNLKADKRLLAISNDCGGMRVDESVYELVE